MTRPALLVAFYANPDRYPPTYNAALALHVEDNECAVSVLNGSGFTILSQDDLSR